MGLYANNAFDFYSSGVFSGCSTYTSSSSINHAVLLIGYTPLGHWIVKNSWGLSWGNNGYIIINKDRDCGLKKYVDVVEVDNSNDHDNDDNNNDNSD